MTKRIIIIFLIFSSIPALAQRPISYRSEVEINEDLQYRFLTGFENSVIEAILIVEGEKDQMPQGHLFLEGPFFSYGIYSPQGLLRDAASESVPGQTILDETCGWEKNTESISWEKDNVMFFFPRYPIGIAWRRRGDHHRISHWGEWGFFPWLNTAWYVQGGFMPYSHDDDSWYGGEPFGSFSGHYLHMGVQTEISFWKLRWFNTIMHSAGESVTPGLSVRERLLLDFKWIMLYYQFDISSSSFTTVNGLNIKSRWTHKLNIDFFLRQYHSFRVETELYTLTTDEIYADETLMIPLKVQWTLNTFRINMKNYSSWLFNPKSEQPLEQWQWYSKFRIHWHTAGVEMTHKTLFEQGKWSPFDDKLLLWWRPLSGWKVSGYLLYQLTQDKDEWNNVFIPGVVLEWNTGQFEIKIKGETAPLSPEMGSKGIKDWSLTLNMGFRIDK